VNCQACHLPDGSGRIGSTLIADTWKHERAATDVGMFEILYGGASGAMQSFSRRGMTQDQMLKVIAYVRSLKKP
jgi:cytochrome c-L